MRAPSEDTNFAMTVDWVTSDANREVAGSSPVSRKTVAQVVERLTPNLLILAAILYGDS